jgi:hypothetical protein
MQCDNEYPYLDEEEKNVMKNVNKMIKIKSQI